MADQFTPNLKDLELVQKYLRETSKDATAFQNAMNGVVTSTTLFKNILEDAKDYYGGLNDIAARLSSSLKDSINEISRGNYFTKSLIGGFKNLEKVADKFKSDMVGYTTLSKDEIKNNIARLQQNRDLLELLKKQGNFGPDQSNIIAELQDVIEENEKLLEYAEKRLEKERLINKNLGISGQIFKGLSKQLKELGADGDVLDEINEKLRTLASDDKKVRLGQLFKVMKEGLLAISDDPLLQLTVGLKLFRSGINDIKRGFEIFKEYDQIFVDAARSTGMTTGQIKNMIINTKQASEEAHKFGSEVSNTLYSTKQIAKAITDINEQLGLSITLEGKTLDEFTAMTNQMGLAANEATNIYKLGLLNNMSLQDTNKTIATGIVAAQKQTGVQINQKQVFQEIGKLSAGITTKFQQNIPALTAAVAQAKVLGTTLEGIDKIGESILNWESSIENELKAELITGKQLNFERARAAALVGDQATLMQEIASQVGNINDFQNMNVIAQKSLAEAFGLSRDELADMLQKQEVFNKLGDVSGKSAAEQLKIARERGLSEEDLVLKNLKQQAAAEKLAAIFDDLKLVLVDLVEGPFQLFVDLSTWLSKNLTAAYAIMGALAGLSLAKVIGGLVLMVAQLQLINRVKTRGIAIDSGSEAIKLSQLSTTQAQISAEAAVAGEKTAGASADTVSEAAKLSQTATAQIQAGVEGTITGEKVAGAGADATSEAAKLSQTATAQIQAGVEGTIAGEKTIGAGADAASEAAKLSQTATAQVQAGVEGTIAGEKVTGAGADIASEAAKLSQTATSQIQAGTEGVIAGEKVAGAGADAASLASKAGQLPLTNAQAGTEAIITGEKAAQAGFTATMSPWLAVAGILAAGAIIGGIYGLVKSRQRVEDGIALSNKGPFQITDSFGNMAITDAGDHIAVSPNIEKTSISNSRKENTYAATDQMDQIKNLISNHEKFLNDFLKKPQPTPQFSLMVNREKLGEVVGRTATTGTEQYKYNSYQLA